PDFVRTRSVGHIDSARGGTPLVRGFHNRRPARGDALFDLAGSRHLRGYSTASLARGVLPSDRRRGGRVVKEACTIAGLPFKEAASKKLLWMALLVGAAFLLLFGLGEHYQSFGARVTPLMRRQIVATQFLVGLYTLNFVILAMTVLTSVDTLSGEISSGTIQA